MMLVRSFVLYLLYLKYRIKYRKQILFRGFSVICALKGSEIQINNSCGGAKFLYFLILLVT